MKIVNTAYNNIKGITNKLPQKISDRGEKLGLAVKSRMQQAGDSFSKGLKDISGSKKAKTVLTVIGIAGAACAAGYVTAIRTLESKFFKIKNRIHYKDDEISDSTREYLEEKRLNTKSGGQISVWDINPDGNEKYAVCCLGFGCPKEYGQAQDSYLELMKRGYGVVTFDYLGWGDSTGDKLTQKGTKESVDAVFDYLHKKGIKNENISLIGHSLGCGVASDYAKDHNVKELILVNPFDDLKSMVKDWINVIPAPGIVKKYLEKTPGGLIPLKNKYNNKKALKHVHCPTLILHSTDDETVKVSHARNLRDKTRRNPSITYEEVEKGGHYLTEEKVNAVLEFMGE